MRLYPKHRSGHRRNNGSERTGEQSEGQTDERADVAWPSEPYVYEKIALMNFKGYEEPFDFE